MDLKIPLLFVPIVILTIREQKHLNHCRKIHIFSVYNNCKRLYNYLQSPIME